MTTNKPNRKGIGYAYASSPLAEEYGHGKTGCTYVYVVENDEEKTVFTSQYKKTCILHAAALPGEWDAWSQYRPE